MIAYKTVGNGSEHVVVMHDWFCDKTSYDTTLPYLDTQKHTYLFTDFRGYGESKSMAGKFNVSEAAADVLAVTESVGWTRFHVVGHSMSGMIAQYIALKAKEKVKSGTAITPVPACGSPAPADMMAFMREAAGSNDEAGRQAVQFMSGQRCCDKFVNMKLAKWRECSTAEARLAYLEMFSNTDFSSEVNGLKTPFLVIAGEHDAPGFQMPKMIETFGKWLKNVEIMECKNAAHYPMLETPVFLATQLEKHFAKHA
jgi:pimeloyl-ACP methyl ester carboxylesterase